MPKPRYEVVRPGLPGSPGRVIAKATSEAVARLAFSRVAGPVVLVRINPDGTRVELDRASA